MTRQSQRAPERPERSYAQRRGLAVDRKPLKQRNTSLFTGIGSPSLNSGTIPLSIVLAEDDFEFRSLLASVLRADGHIVAECSDGQNLLARLGVDQIPEERESFDLVISDIRMPGVTGLEVLKRIRLWERSPAWILMTAFGDAETHRTARHLRVVAMFDKPFDIDNLRSKVRELATGSVSD